MCAPVVPPTVASGHFEIVTKQFNRLGEEWRDLKEIVAAASMLKRRYVAVIVSDSIPLRQLKYFSRSSRRC